MKTFQGRLEVSNYPMLGRSEAQLKELERIRDLRSVEVVEKRVNTKNLLAS